MEPVSWSVRPTESRPLRRLCYAVLGLFGGLAVLVAAILLSLALDRLAAGDARLLALLAVLAAIGAAVVLSVRRELDDPARRPDALPVRLDRLDPQWLAISSLAGAAAVWFLARASLVAALGVVALAAVTPVALLGAAATSGAVDPESRTLTLDGRDVDLDDVAGVTACAVGPATLLRLSGGHGGSGPGLLVLPTEAAVAVRRTVSSGDREDADSRDPDGSSPEAAGERHRS